MPELTEIKGVGPILAKACAENGYDDVEKIAAAILHDLVAVPGLSEVKAKLVIAAAQGLLQNGSASITESVSMEAVSEPVAMPTDGVKAKKQKAEKKKKKDKKKDKKKLKKKKKKEKKTKKKGKKS